MERRNKRKNLACKCNIEVSFLVYVFLFFHGSLFGYKTQKSFVYFSVCQCSLHPEPAVHLRSLSAHPVAAGCQRPSLRPLVWLVDSFLQRNIPMKSAKNAMRLMWWPPTETVEEDQCCGQSQVPGLYPAVCLSELPWWTPILSSVCLGRVFFLFPSWDKRGERVREKEGGGEGRGQEKRLGNGKGKEFLEDGWKGKGGDGGGEGLSIAHRLRGLCVGPGSGLSGPLAFLCSLALGKKRTHKLDTN